MIELNVSVPGGEYPVQIEAGLLPRVGALVQAVHTGRRGLVVMDDNVHRPHGDSMVGGFDDSWTLEVEGLDATEANKRPETVSAIYQSCLRAGLDRGSVIVGLGGGITGDVVGFAAASFMRGIAVVHVPTTLLAMVDAAVGGKTGVNLPLPDGSGVGKNLAGAFWQPRAVLIDPLVLGTLPSRDLRCGLAECIKHGFIGDPGLLEMIESNLDAILQADPDAITSLVHRAVQVKIGVIQEDEREAGGRAALNLGHTFAHAIEPIQRLDLRHGEAVAIGLVAAAQCARELDRVGDEVVDRTRSLVVSAGLPAGLPEAVDIDLLMAAMRFDKKTRDGRLRLVLSGNGGVHIVDDVPVEAVRAAWQAVGAGG